MRWQVAYYFFFLLETGAQVLKCTTWKCANHRSILLWWNLLSVWILHFCRLGKEAILAHSTMLTQCYFKINHCLLLIILHLLKVKWGGFQVTFPQKGGSEPWTVCKDGSFPRCPFGSRTICPFRIRKCADRLANLWKNMDRFKKNWSRAHCVSTPRSEPRRQCTVGMPHCPWFTKNRNNPWNFSEEKFNRGPNRPQNKDKAYFRGWATPKTHERGTQEKQSPGTLPKILENKRLHNARFNS